MNWINVKHGLPECDCDCFVRGEADYPFHRVMFKENNFYRVSGKGKIWDMIPKDRISHYHVIQEFKEKGR